MALETIFGISFLALAVIGYAVSHIPKTRLKFVDQKAKDCSKTAYTIVLYI